MPLSWIYGSIINLRNALYERGRLASLSLGAPAISVGNITVGGTGKTPMVAFVAETLAETGARVCVLTRGYGRENPRERVLVSDGEKILTDYRKAGDEPFELARRLLGKALVVADADRAAAGRWAREKFGVTAFVLDDAFQHRRARRELDIVLVDATNPFGNRKTLPFGILREPLENLRRAGLIVVTRADLVDEEKIANLKTEISKYNPDRPVLTARNELAALTEITEFARSGKPPAADRRPPAADRDQASAAFCALGNPDNFFEQLKREGFALKTTIKFPDHHRYARTDIAKIEAEARRTGAQILLTTAKDAVKLADFPFELPCRVVESRLVFDDEKSLRKRISIFEFRISD
ncbi:MAG: tetraacyldisaccharide 4'-kinase [Acidobacteria bacterium]|nr:tetraacyldisaccharide 4'-kinase [Acidobacteriota bacterium]